MQVVNLNNKQQPRPWTYGYFDCFGDIGSCLWASCLPCFAYAEVREQQGEGWCCACLSYYCCLGCCCGVPTASMLGAARSACKADNNIRSNSSCDGFIGDWCCTCCSLIQVHREMKYVASNPTDKGDTTVIMSQPQLAPQVNVSVKQGDYNKQGDTVANPHQPGAYPPGAQPGMQMAYPPQPSYPQGGAPPHSPHAHYAPPGSPQPHYDPNRSPHPHAQPGYPQQPYYNGSQSNDSFHQPMHDMHYRPPQGQYPPSPGQNYGQQAPQYHSQEQLPQKQGYANGPPPVQMSQGPPRPPSAHPPQEQSTMAAPTYDTETSAKKDGSTPQPRSMDGMADHEAKDSDKANLGAKDSENPHQID